MGQKKKWTTWEEFLSECANAIRQRNNNDAAKIRGYNIPEAILNIRDIFSDMGVISSFERDALSVYYYLGFAKCYFDMEILLDLNILLNDFSDISGIEILPLGIDFVLKDNMGNEEG